jgi:hypothetical protein
MAVAASWHYHTGTGEAGSCEGATFGNAIDTDDRLYLEELVERVYEVGSRRNVICWNGKGP